MRDPANIAPVLDLNGFAFLGENLPLSTMEELVDLFVCETETYMAEILSRRACGDWQAIGRLSRNIVGIAGNLCAARASLLARELDHACRTQQRVNCYRLVGEMSQACRDASQEMRDWLQAHAPRLAIPDGGIAQT
jgi:HPt (histidine-containing phosphotransfer) domain-containing protein